MVTLQSALEEDVGVDTDVGASCEELISSLGRLKSVPETDSAYARSQNKSEATFLEIGGRRCLVEYGAIYELSF